MSRLTAVFFFILLLVGLDYFAFQVVKTLISNSNSTIQTTVGIIYWSISGLIAFGLLSYFFTNTDRWPHFLKSTLLVAVVGKLFSAVFMSVFLLIEDVFRFIYELFGISEEGVDQERSTVWNGLALAAGVSPPIAMGWGIISGAHDYRIRKVSLNMPSLPRAFDGIRIAQISDIHSGSFHNRVAVQGGVDLLMQQKPDLVFFTGDLVNNQAEEMRHYTNVFDKVQAPLGVYSILGNHDYGDYVRWSDQQAKSQNLARLKEIHRTMGWDLLLNENRKIQVDGEHIALLGVENWGARGFAKYGDLGQAWNGTDESPVKILLSHDPSHWSAQVLRDFNDIDLTLSGHTHGMQFGVEIGNIKWSPVQYVYKEWAGLYENESRYLYVNRGYGYLAYPGRIGIPPEITIIELKVP